MTSQIVTQTFKNLTSIRILFLERHVRNFRRLTLNMCLSKIMLWHFTEKCMESRASKLFINGAFGEIYGQKLLNLFCVLILRYLVIQDIPTCRTTTEHTYQIPVCANVCGNVSA